MWRGVRLLPSQLLTERSPWMTPATLPCGPGQVCVCVCKSERMRVCPERGRPCFNPPQPPDDYPLSTPSSSPSFSSSSSSCLLVLPNLFILHNSPSKSVLLRLVALMTRGHQQRDALSSASVLQRCDLILHARPYQRFQTVRQLCSVVLACGAHMCVSVVFAMGLWLPNACSV